jgi:signal transduction histidine kinase
MLHEFLTAHTADIIARTRQKVAARTAPLPTAEQLQNGVPLFLAQLVDRLRSATTDSAAISGSAARHGAELLAMGFTVSQVVHGYGDVCQVITELADENESEISPEEFHVFNRCLDDAIAHAVTAFEHGRDAFVAYDETARTGVLAHEMRGRVHAALLAFSMLQQGTVGIGGSTSAALGRSLRQLRDLVNNSLVGVRLDSGIALRQRVSVSAIVSAVEEDASMEAAAGGFKLALSPLAPSVEVDVDQQVLSAAISNLLQNAFKFSRRYGHVSLRTSATADHVRIEVEDECGGLPPGKAEDLFRPFEQRNADRSGLGLGLSISRKGVEAMGGTLGVRDLPGKGCVFFIDLPRLPAA